MKVVDWQARTVNFCAAERGTSYSADATGKPRIVVQCPTCGANAEKRETWSETVYVHQAKIRAARRVGKGDGGERELRESTATLVFEIVNCCKVATRSAPSSEATDSQSGASTNARRSSSR